MTSTLMIWQAPVHAPVSCIPSATVPSPPDCCNLLPATVQPPASGAAPLARVLLRAGHLPPGDAERDSSRGLCRRRRLRTGLPFRQQPRTPCISTLCVILLQSLYWLRLHACRLLGTCSWSPLHHAVCCPWQFVTAIKHVDSISAEQLRDSHAGSAIRLQSLCHHLQLLSARPECRTRDGRVVRAVRRVFRTSPEQPRFQFDWQRTGRLAAFGGAIAGPLGHVWFQALDANIMPATPRRCAH